MRKNINFKVIKFGDSACLRRSAQYCGLQIKFNSMRFSQSVPSCLTGVWSLAESRFESVFRPTTVRIKLPISSRFLGLVAKTNHVTSEDLEGVSVSITTRLLFHNGLELETKNGARRKNPRYGDVVYTDSV